MATPYNDPDYLNLGPKFDSNDLCTISGNELIIGEIWFENINEFAKIKGPYRICKKQRFSPRELSYGDVNTSASTVFFVEKRCFASAKFKQMKGEEFSQYVTDLTMGRREDVKIIIIVSVVSYEKKFRNCDASSLYGDLRRDKKKNVIVVNQYEGPFTCYDGTKSNHVFNQGGIVRFSKANPPMEFGLSGNACNADAPSGTIGYFPSYCPKGGKIDFISDEDADEHERFGSLYLNRILGVGYVKWCDYVTPGPWQDINYPISLPDTSINPDWIGTLLQGWKAKYENDCLPDDSPVGHFAMCCSDFDEIHMNPGIFRIWNYENNFLDYHEFQFPEETVGSTENDRILLVEKGEHFSDGYDIVVTSEDRPYTVCCIAGWTTAQQVYDKALKEWNNSYENDEFTMNSPEYPDDVVSWGFTSKCDVNQYEGGNALTAMNGLDWSGDVNLNYSRAKKQSGLNDGTPCYVGEYFLGRSHFMVVRASIMHNTFKVGKGKYVISNYEELGTFNHDEITEVQYSFDSNNERDGYVMYPDGGGGSCSFAFVPFDDEAVDFRPPYGSIVLATFAAGDNPKATCYKRTRVYLEDENGLPSVLNRKHEPFQVVFAGPTMVFICGGKAKYYEPGFSTVGKTEYKIKEMEIKSRFCGVGDDEGKYELLYDPYSDEIKNVKSGTVFLDRYKYQRVATVEVGREIINQQSVPWITNITDHFNPTLSFRSNSSFAIYLKDLRHVGVNKGRVYFDRKGTVGDHNNPDYYECFGTEFSFPNLENAEQVNYAILLHVNQYSASMEAVQFELGRNVFELEEDLEKSLTRVIGTVVFFVDKSQLTGGQVGVNISQAITDDYVIKWRIWP